jgi:hypothetical protein
MGPLSLQRLAFPANILALIIPVYSIQLFSLNRRYKDMGKSVPKRLKQRVVRGSGMNLSLVFYVSGVL